MPLPFLKGRRKEPEAMPSARVPLPTDRLELVEQALRLQYHAISSHGVLIPASEGVPVLLANLFYELNITPVELIEPLPIEFQDAEPSVIRPELALQWINAHHSRTPIARHALLILQSLDAIDLAYETFAVAMLHGVADADGVPRFDAIVGGPVSYWDENSGQLIVRMLVGYGGEGVRGDTQRIAQRLLGKMLGNLLASQGATELGRVERPVAVGGGHVKPCGHCGFSAMDRRAHYCPKCGMRQDRA